ncbi:NAD(P)-dependent oxidoreductase [Rhodovibrio salinarum]|uniref:NAD(P)-dependent oxidoreductase n=1 Tax=Rhodovibrio salinarum TaxID=1087 RepID=A0A934V178_9PROT|nr:NAD(P)-dependent oxidoreductase [Rhodovibrio salinarum]MBK1699117.1 NAD(P)-dependent oxidoreductase [Rhodovibrio salinarum]
MEKRIGFIGVGLMGYGPARLLLEAGYPLTLLGHRNRAPVDDLVGRGAQEAETAAELTRNVDVVITCVSSSAIMEKLVHGDDGIAAGAREGQVLVDMTTADPQSTRALAATLAEWGMRMIDAPMTRTPREAREGRLNLLLGGEAADIDALEPLLEVFSENRFRTGPLGSAHTTKLVNNALSLGHAALAAEAAVTCKAAGVDPQVLYDIVTAGGADSKMFRMVMPAAIEDRVDGLEFTLGNARKDYGYYLQCARDAGCVPMTTQAVHQLFEVATAQGNGDEYVPYLYRMLNGWHSQSS